ncbi:type VI secretion system tube protein TssD [Mariniflexile ostreae]|uniref:Type VI secretion system tube protein TssD n=1 Tax=Mariniflexile ostreae TaxID=1520892 RepID=A0ABV5FET7_9FLAO
MTEAKLFILGQEIELIWSDMNYYRDIQMNGKPATGIMGGLITVCLATNHYTDLILRWMTKESEYDTWNEAEKTEKGKVCFYENGFDYPPTKTYEFNDSHLIYFKETFNAEGKQPMQTILTISPAIQNYGADFVKLWNENWIPPSERMPYQPMEQEQGVDLKFIAKFERIDSTYRGGFGFDWMRDSYTSICQDYENLKQVYTPTSIHGEEYFVPWLSMFPNQAGVMLKLTIKEKEGTVKDSDIIKLPSKNGIKFVPNEIKVSEANGKEITIFCESALSNDTAINLIDKDDKIVGKLNLLKNDENLTLKVKLVKVKGNEVDNKI